MLRGQNPSLLPFPAATQPLLPWFCPSPRETGPPGCLCWGGEGGVTKEAGGGLICLPHCRQELPKRRQLVAARGLRQGRLAGSQAPFGGLDGGLGLVWGDLVGFPARATGPSGACRDGPGLAGGVGGRPLAGSSPAALADGRFGVQSGWEGRVGARSTVSMMPSPPGPECLGQRRSEHAVTVPAQGEPCANPGLAQLRGQADIRPRRCLCASTAGPRQEARTGPIPGRLLPVGPGVNAESSGLLHGGSQRPKASFGGFFTGWAEGGLQS